MGVSTDVLSKDASVCHEWANGHFEVKGHVAGDLTVRGRKFKVDCYEGMDHSWGPRKELGTRAVSWISIDFGKDLAVHLAVPMKIEKDRVSYDKAQFGFVADHGEVYGVTEATDWLRVHVGRRHERMRNVRSSTPSSTPWTSASPSGGRVSAAQLRSVAQGCAKSE